MKKCSQCNQSKPPDEFPFRNKKTGERHSWCKPCRVVYQRNWFLSKPEKRLEHAERVKRDKAKRADFIRKSKDRPCFDCKQNYPHYVMDFDHVPERGEKLFVIAAKGAQVSQKRLQEELAKCDVVCANCHRIRTHNRDTRSRTENPSV